MEDHLDTYIALVKQLTDLVPGTPAYEEVVLRLQRIWEKVPLSQRNEAIRREIESHRKPLLEG